MNVQDPSVVFKLSPDFIEEEVGRSEEKAFNILVMQHLVSSGDFWNKDNNTL
jgi:hypothetical protein